MPVYYLGDGQEPVGGLNNSRTPRNPQYKSYTYCGYLLRTSVEIHFALSLQATLLPFFFDLLVAFTAHSKKPLHLLYHVAA
jgi:hypothetical protein